MSTISTYAELVERARATVGTGRLAKAAGWLTAGHIATQVFRIGSQLVLARLLAPEMFGIMGIVSVVQVILGLTTDVGMRIAVIRSSRGHEPVFLDTIWTLQLVRGALVFGLSLLIAGGLLLAGRAALLPVGSTWAASELPLIMAVTSFSTVVGSFQSTNLLLAERNLDQRRLMVLELASQTVSIAFVLVLATMTGSIWALVSGWFVSSLFVTIASHVWLPGTTNRLAWDRDSLEEVRTFGGWILLSSIMTVFAANLDRLILAALVDPAALGFYTIAFNLVLIIDSFGTRIIGGVAFPALSEAARSEPARVRATLYRLRWPLDALLLLASGFLFVMGPALVHLVYDRRYEAVGPLLQILALSLAVMRFNVFSVVYMALGRPEWQAFVNMAKVVSLLCVLPPLFAAYGLSGAAYGIALHGLIVVPLQYFLNARCNINNLTFELVVLLFWGAGFALGHLALAASRLVGL